MSDMIFRGAGMDQIWDKFGPVIYSPRLGCVMTWNMNYVFMLSSLASLSKIPRQRNVDRLHLKYKGIFASVFWFLRQIRRVSSLKGFPI
jgi:hypothetical protein